jgi:hypothetical protein
MAARKRLCLDSEQSDSSLTSTSDRDADLDNSNDKDLEQTSECNCSLFCTSINESDDDDTWLFDVPWMQAGNVKVQVLLSDKNDCLEAYKNYMDNDIIII